MVLGFDLKEHLAALVDGSHDAIITKDLNSIITSWNSSAERIFGYRADEIIGKPVTVLMPDDRKHEEAGIIARLRRGEQIRHYETVRRRKDGTLIPISLTVSPIRDDQGKFVGASKIARDITLEREAKEMQRLLLAEMKHRLKNSFAVAGGVVNICARQAETIEELVELTHERLNALAAAHSQAILDPEAQADLKDKIPLEDLIRSVISPLVASDQVDIFLDDVSVSPRAVTSLALVFHELATDALKYGAFSKVDGILTVRSERRDDRLIIHWSETGGDSYSPEDDTDGFGTRLIKNVVRSSLSGSFERSNTPQGLSVILNLAMQTLQDAPETRPDDSVRCV